MYVINIITNTNYNEAAIYIHIMFYHNLQLNLNPQKNKGKS